MNGKINRKKMIIIIVLAVAVVVAGVMSWLAGTKKSGSVTVAAGDGTIAIARKLDDKGIIRSRGVFRMMARIYGADDGWRAGTYKITGGESIVSFFHDCTKPHANEIRVTIPEGKQVREIAKILEKAGVCDADEFLSACVDHKFDYDFLDGIDTSSRISGLEGYLFPDTYYFEKDSDPDAVIKTMLNRFEEKVYTKKIKAAAKKQGLTIDQTVILASMVESEATTKSDREKVAGVFLSRLRSTSGWKLQSCVTVEYAKGMKKAVISYEDTQYDSPYNTYLHAGLPYGPICCPGMESINAVLHPTKTNYRYFVSDGKGRLYFAKTYEEHVKNSEKLYPSS